MAIDPGEKRWGIAVSDEDGELAHVRPALLPRSQDEGLRAVAALAVSEGTEVIVMGLPLELSGREGTSAKKARALAARVAQTTRKSVALWDERLSSVAASRALRSQGLNEKQQRGKVDSVAAALLLQAFLDAAPAVRARAIAHPESTASGEKA